MNPFVILLWGRDALLAQETLTCIYLTIRPVALEGEGSNCFSINQLFGQKRQQ